jgi:hypothetical protein
MMHAVDDASAKKLSQYRGLVMVPGIATVSEYST